MGRRWCFGAAAGVLAASAAGAQHDLAPLLALVPDEAVVVAVAAAPPAAARALAAVCEPLPPGLPAEVVTRLGLGLSVLRTAFAGSTAEWLQVVADGGALLALVPPPAGGAWQWLVVTRPADLAAATAWWQARAPHVPRAVVDDRLRLGTCTAGPGTRWARTPLAARPGTGIAAAVDLAALRQHLGASAPDLQRLAGGARFLAAPGAHALAVGSWLQLELAATATRLCLAAEVDASVRTAPFGALLAPAAPAAPAPAAMPGRLAMVQLDRSVRALLTEPGRFLAEDDAQAVRGFLSIAEALDGPQSAFVDDLLGGLQEPFALQVLPAAPADDEAAAAPIRLPEFVLVAPVVDERAVAAAFRVVQALATIANAERVQRGEAPFVVRRRQDETGRGLCAEPPPWRGPGAPPLDRQLSPTLWCGGGRLAIGSTCRAAQAACAAPDVGAAAGGDRIVLHGPPLAAAIAASRSALEVARMLDEGEDRAEAERFFAALVAIVDAIARLDVALVAGPAATRLEITVERRR